MVTKVVCMYVRHVLTLIQPFICLSMLFIWYRVLGLNNCKEHDKKLPSGVNNDSCAIGSSE